ncbi:MAG: hypothetical protein IAI50_21025, partial [Candidatus Eremiobacteraeota bacterium]|nr:hypothetical protein [Candidatus Eremiobacteraeota bacterium]
MLLGPLDIVILFSAMATSPTAVPEPQPTELREIGHVKTTAFCKTFEQLVVPLTLIARHNENAFVSLEAPVARFRGGEGFAANGAAIHDALTQGSSSLQTVESSAVANADPMASDEDDDDDTYTPERRLAAANIDRIVMQIRLDLVLADKVMDQSWKAVPGQG